MKKIRWGILSSAKIGTEKVIPAMQQSGTGEIQALASRSHETAKKICGELGIPKSYGSYEELLADPEIDAVYNPLPNHLHVPWTIEAARSGKHVLCEKPMATTTSDARAFIKTAEENGKILAVAYQRHGEGKFIRAREMIRNGVIGDVRLVHVIIAQDCLGIFQPGASWRADPALSGGGHFMDTGSHINDILLWTTGLEPKQVHAFIGEEGTQVDVNTSISVEFANGAVGSLSYTSQSPEWREEFTFYGSEGVMRFGAAEPLMVHRKGEDIILPRAASGGKSPAQNFIDAIQGHAAVQAPPICGLRVAQLTEAAYASAKSGKSEPVG